MNELLLCGVVKTAELKDWGTKERNEAAVTTG